MDRKNEELKKALKSIVEDRNSEVLTNPEKLKALLKDLCPASQDGIDVLVNLSKNHMFNGILEQSRSERSANITKAVNFAASYYAKGLVEQVNEVLADVFDAEKGEILIDEQNPPAKNGHGETSKKSGGKGIMIALAVIVLLAGAGVFFISRNKPASRPSSSSSAYPSMTISPYHSEREETQKEPLQFIASHVSAGSHHTAAIKNDGTVIGVGNNEDGRLDFEDWDHIVSIAAGGDFTAGLKDDGTVILNGKGVKNLAEALDWKNVVQISTSSGHLAALHNDGTVSAAGDNNHGQCEVSEWKDITHVYTGDFHTIGLKKDGTLVTAGDNTNGQCDVENWENIVSVGTSYTHTVGLKSDGTLVTVGANEDGECNLNGWNDIKQIDAGYRYTVGLKNDGTAVAVGHNNGGECDVSDWQDIIEIDAGFDHTVALKADGTAVVAGSNYSGQANVSGFQDLMTE